MTRLVRFSPNSDVRNIQREIDRVFDSFFPARTGGSSGGTAEPSNWTPRVDLAETEDAYLVHLDVPGVSKEDIEINVQDGTLAVRGARKLESKEEKQNFVRVERSSGSFYRSFTLPQSVKESEIKAEYQDGVLTIHVPKAEETKPRRIEIN